MTKQVLFLASIAAAIFFVVGPVKAAQSTYPVEATVFTCDANGTCDTSAGENSTNCAADCGCNNNGVCEAGRLENASNCAADCVVAVCGDGVCDASLGETYGNCAADCHCGNGLCDHGETNASCSADCAVTTPTGGGLIFLEINNLQIRQSSLDSAIISWRTNLPAMCRFFWGENQQYGAGLMTETFYSLIHSVDLEKLTAEKIYYFKINCQEAGGRQATLDQASFIIKKIAVPAVEEIVNVSNLNAGIIDGRVRLSWQDPPDKNYDEVLIVRNETWPAGLGSGEVVYRGPGEKFGSGWVAYDLKLPKNKAYYTVFGVKGDKYSSGSFFTLIVSGEKVVEEIPGAPVQKGLNLYDFDFLADGKSLPIIDGVIAVPVAAKRFNAYIDEMKIPAGIDFLSLTVKAPSSTQEFLFAKDEFNKRWSAIVGRLAIGDYELYLTGYDQKGKAISRVQGRIKVTGFAGWLALSALFAGLADQIKVGYQYQSENVREIWWLWLILTVVVMLVFFWLKKRRKKKK